VEEKNLDHSLRCESEVEGTLVDVTSELGEEWREEKFIEGKVRAGDRAEKRYKWKGGSLVR
jgi:hypothetical protein